MTRPTLQCALCRHLHRLSREQRVEGGYRCAAYPDGIPRAILFGLHDHELPYQGDRGIHFDPVDREIACVIEETNTLTLDWASATAALGDPGG